MAPSTLIGMKMDVGAVLPAPYNLLLFWSSLSDADLLEVTVTKVLQPPLDVLFHSAKFYFSMTNAMLSSIQSKVLL